MAGTKGWKDVLIDARSQPKQCPFLPQEGFMFLSERAEKIAQFAAFVQGRQGEKWDVEA